MLKQKHVSICECLRLKLVFVSICFAWEVSIRTQQIDKFYDFKNFWVQKYVIFLFGLNDLVDHIWFSIN